MHDITQLWGMCIIGKEEEDSNLESAFVNLLVLPHIPPHRFYTDEWNEGWIIRNNYYQILYGPKTVHLTPSTQEWSINQTSALCSSISTPAKLFRPSIIYVDIYATVYDRFFKCELPLFSCKCPYFGLHTNRQKMNDEFVSNVQCVMTELATVTQCIDLNVMICSSWYMLDVYKFTYCVSSLRRYHTLHSATVIDEDWSHSSHQSLRSVLVTSVLIVWLKSLQSSVTWVSPDHFGPHCMTEVTPVISHFGQSWSLRSSLHDWSHSGHQSLRSVLVTSVLFAWLKWITDK